MEPYLKLVDALDTIKAMLTAATGIEDADELEKFLGAGKPSDVIRRLASEHRDMKWRLRSKYGESFPDDPKPTPIFTCGCCGENVYFGGAWSPPQHERQLKAAKERHAACRPSIDGAGI